MDRSKRFLSAVGSGYASVVVFACLNLISVPFALAALGKGGFGVAVTVVQIAAFSQVLQFGVGNSLARFFVDRRNTGKEEQVASLLKTAFIIGIIQACLLLAIAWTSTSQLSRLFSIPSEYTITFESVAMWSLAAAALAFVFNPLQQLMYASQRIDIINYISIASQAAGTTVLIGLLIADYGVKSYAVSAWTTMAIGAVMALFITKKAGILPSLRRIPADLAALPALLKFSGNVMMASLGLHLINIGPALVINRTLGVAAMGEWSVGTRLLQLGAQVTGRIPNAAEPTLWQIFSSGDKPRCGWRLMQTAELAAVAATLFGVCLVGLNNNFVQLWSGGRVVWPLLNDLFGSAILWTSAFASSWCMLPGITKRLGYLKFVYIAEGLLIMTLLLVPYVVDSLAVVLGTMLVGLIAIRFAFGVARVNRDLGDSPWRTVSTVCKPLALWCAAMTVAVIVRVQLEGNSSWSVLLSAAVVCASVWALAAYFFMLSPELRTQVNAILKRIQLRRGGND